jgi:hypothetical protein
MVDISVSNKCCVVFTCNKLYLDKFIFTYKCLINKGKYNGDACLIVGDDLKDIMNNHPFIKSTKIIIKYFPDIKFDNNFMLIQNNCYREPHWCSKLFQYHKLYLFNTFFKQWDYILYLDCGIKIFDDIKPILDTRLPNTILAHSDAYPEYTRTLDTQFCKYIISFNKQLIDIPHYKNLKSIYGLDHNYFQTTIMLYDTNIITDTTFNDLYTLCIEYPISWTNDQGIIALYFTQIKKLWKQIPLKNDNTYFYDYLSRHPSYSYIMLKTYKF